MAQKVVRKARKTATAPAAKKMIPKTVIEEQFPEVEKIETIEVDTPKQPEKTRPVKRRRNLHPVEVNGVVRMLTKFAYMAVAKNPSAEVILPKDSPYQGLNDCEGC